MSFNSERIKNNLVEDGASAPATVDANVASMGLPFGVNKKDVTSPKKTNPYIKKSGSEQKKLTLASLRLRAQGTFQNDIP